MTSSIRDESMIDFLQGKIDENDERNVLNWYCSKFGIKAISFRLGRSEMGAPFVCKKIGPEKAY